MCGGGRRETLEISFQTLEEEKLFNLLSAKFMEEENVQYADENKILFWVPEAAHLWDSMKPLFCCCIQRGYHCTVVFDCRVDNMMKVGLQNAKCMCAIVDEIRELGGQCYLEENSDKYLRDYMLCFTCSDYTKLIDWKLKKRCRYVVAVQITAIYTHVYVGTNEVCNIFGENENKVIDYVVVSDFAADWIAEKALLFRDKLLRFGYPKMDNIYKGLQQKENIPAEWIKKFHGKKVFLVIGAVDEPDWISKIEDSIIIYRPHPYRRDIEERAGLLEKYRRMDNVIVDDTGMYYAAFQASDALICSLLCSVAVNYLFTEKPVLLLEGKRFDSRSQYVSTYEIEPWYKASYIAKTEQEIIDFVRMVKEDTSVDKKKMSYRRYMQHGFDGNVCNRIMQYFEDKMT